jgi:hypothetical protein
MFTSDSLRIYRKFFILAVMIAGLFIANSVTNPAEASVCCSTCNPSYYQCIVDCYNPNPGKWEQCVHEECDPALGYCQTTCNQHC